MKYEVDYYVSVRVSRFVDTAWYEDNYRGDVNDADAFAEWIARSGWLEEFDASQISDVDGTSIDVMNCTAVTQ